MDTDTLNWTKEEFYAFLLIYASYADLEFCHLEKEAILNFVDPEEFEGIQKLHESMGEYERLEFILNFKDQYYSTPETKKNMMDIILEHFHQDGEVSKLELSLYKFLDRLL